MSVPPNVIVTLIAVTGPPGAGLLVGQVGVLSPQMVPVKTITEGNRAVTVAVPGATPVTSPFCVVLFTARTDVLLLLQELLVVNEYTTPLQ